MSIPGLTREQFHKIQRMTRKRLQSAKAGTQSADSGLGRDSSGSNGRSSGNGGTGAYVTGTGYGSGYQSRMRARRERTRRSCSVGSAGEVAPQPAGRGPVGGPGTAVPVRVAVSSSRESWLVGHESPPCAVSVDHGSGRLRLCLPACDAGGASGELHCDGLAREQQQQQQQQQQEQHHQQYQQQHQQQGQAICLTRGLSGAKLEQSYALEDVIGRGAWGIVTACRHRGSGQRFACKTVFKRLLEEEGRLAQLRNEVRRVGCMLRSTGRSVRKRLICPKAQIEVEFLSSDISSRH